MSIRYKLSLMETETYSISKTGKMKKKPISSDDDSVPTKELIDKIDTDLKHLQGQRKILQRAKEGKPLRYISSNEKSQNQTKCSSKSNVHHKIIKVADSSTQIGSSWKNLNTNQMCYDRSVDTEFNISKNAYTVGKVHSIKTQTNLPHKYSKQHSLVSGYHQLSPWLESNHGEKLNNVPIKIEGRSQRVQGSDESQNLQHNHKNKLSKDAAPKHNSDRKSKKMPDFIIAKKNVRDGKPIISYPRSQNYACRCRSLQKHAKLSREILDYAKHRRVSNKAHHAYTKDLSGEKISSEACRSLLPSPNEVLLSDFESSKGYDTDHKITRTENNNLNETSITWKSHNVNTIKLINIDDNTYSYPENSEENNYLILPYKGIANEEIDYSNLPAIPTRQFSGNRNRFTKDISSKPSVHLESTTTQQSLNPPPSMRNKREAKEYESYHQFQVKNIISQGVVHHEINRENKLLQGSCEYHSPNLESTWESHINREGPLSSKFSTSHNNYNLKHHSASRSPQSINSKSDHTKCTSKPLISDQNLKNKQTNVQSATKSTLETKPEKRNSTLSQLREKSMNKAFLRSNSKSQSSIPFSINGQTNNQALSMEPDKWIESKNTNSVKTSSDQQSKNFLQSGKQSQFHAAKTSHNSHDMESARTSNISDLCASSKVGINGNHLSQPAFFAHTKEYAPKSKQTDFEKRPQKHESYSRKFDSNTSVCDYAFGSISKTSSNNKELISTTLPKYSETQNISRKISQNLNSSSIESSLKCQPKNSDERGDDFEESPFIDPKLCASMRGISLPFEPERQSKMDTPKAHPSKKKQNSISELFRSTVKGSDLDATEKHIALTSSQFNIHKINEKHSCSVMSEDIHESELAKVCTKIPCSPKSNKNRANQYLELFPAKNNEVKQSFRKLPSKFTEKPNSSISSKSFQSLYEQKPIEIFQGSKSSTVFNSANLEDIEFSTRSKFSLISAKSLEKELKNKTLPEKGISTLSQMMPKTIQSNIPVKFVQREEVGFKSDNELDENSGQNSSSKKENRIFLSDTFNQNVQFEGVSRDVSNLIQHLENRVRDCDQHVKNQSRDLEKLKENCSKEEELFENTKCEDNLENYIKEENSCHCVLCEQEKSTSEYSEEIPPFTGCECMKEDYDKIMQIAYSS